MADEEDVRDLRAGNPDMAQRDLRDGDFTGLDLSERDFSGARLQKAVFSNANLSFSKFLKAHTSWMIADGANLTSVYAPDTVVFGVNFNNANLRNSDFSRSHFSKVDLTGSDLRGADFSNAVFNEENTFKDCVVDATTKFDGATIFRPLARQPAFQHYLVKSGVLVRKSDEEIRSANGRSRNRVFAAGTLAAIDFVEPGSPEFEITQESSTGAEASVDANTNPVQETGLISESSRADLEVNFQNTVLPQIPEQAIGPSFEISEGGKIGLANTGLISNDDDLVQLEGVRDVLLQALYDLIEATEGSNAFPNINSVARRYSQILESDILAISIYQLSALGIRLHNSRERIRVEIANGELPDTGSLIEEALDSVLDIHGPFVLSTQPGFQFFEQSRLFTLGRTEEFALKKKLQEFATAVDTSKDLVEPGVKEGLEDTIAEIGQGRFPERSSFVAVRFVSNFITYVGKLIVDNALVSSSVGSFAIGMSADLINSAMIFVSSYSQELKSLAVLPGLDLSWLPTFLDWWKNRK